MQALANKKIVVGLSVAYVLLATFLITREFYYAPLLPIGLAIAGMTFFALDKLLYFIIFFTPISITLEEPELGIAVGFPTEPLIFGIMLIFFLKLLVEGKFDKGFMLHPLSLVVILHLVWMAFTTLTSEMPLVSFKYFLVRLWSVVVMFWVMSRLFTNETRIKRFFWLYLIPLAVVVIWSVYNHALQGFSKQASVMSMYPLMKEHTSYGAVLALYFPVAFGFAFLQTENLNKKSLSFSIFIIIAVGLIFSYTRAAWVSVVVAAVVWALMALRINKLGFWSLFAVFLGLLLFFQGPILQKLSSNKQDSSDDLSEHVESIANISSDASNLERINRWKSAIRMFSERPLLGFGPGTYQFTYAPFQNPREKTIISTNNGDVGNAHSEYIGPLAEQGWPGLMFVVLMVFLMMKTGVRVIYRNHDPKEVFFATAAMLGLVTYWTHGFLNNFLDLDKAALPVWGFAAMLVMMDLKRVNWTQQAKQIER